MTTGRTARARARPNIALVKYWGKRDDALNLPAVGSVSMTLARFVTTTRVTFRDDLVADRVRLDGRPAPEPAADRVSSFLDRVRQRMIRPEWAEVDSRNGFPTAGGLASSASAFAALGAAAVAAAGVDVSFAELAGLARSGSGSAPRSLLGGFVELPRGARSDGSDCVPRQLLAEGRWDLRLVVAIGDVGPKAVGSTEGMRHTATSAGRFYEAWLDQHPAELDTATAAIGRRDLAALGPVVERSAMRMHATMLAAWPPLLYWRPATIACIRRTWALRAEGRSGYVTIDAGPHVKVLTTTEDAPHFAEALRVLPGVSAVHVDEPGPGVELA